MYKLKNKKYRSFAIITAMFIVSVAAVIFYVSWSFDAQKPEAEIKAGVKEEGGLDRASDLDGWKVYYSRDYGFALDYPGAWNVEETKNQDLTVNSVYFGKPVNGYYPAVLNFFKKPSGISLKDWVDKNTYFSGTFQKGFVESKGTLPNYYIDKIMIGGTQAYKTTLLSDTYFFPKVYEGKLDDYYSRCKCDYDSESVYVLNGDMIISLTLTNNMNGKKTSNDLVQRNGRYEVESSDRSYLENKRIFSNMTSSFRFAAVGR